jgi:hypothetical protein
MAKTIRRVSPAAHPAAGDGWQSRLVRALAFLLAAVPLCAAQAALIDFDDLPPPDPPEGMWEHSTTPIDVNAYASQGVLIAGSFVAEGVSGGQALRASSSSLFTFIGTLPSFVSMQANWLPEDILNIQAVGPSGWASTFHVFGYQDGPSVPPGFGDQVISFASPSGISSLSFAGSQFNRFPARIDNLYFGPVPAVPVPASALLLGAGLLTMGFVRRRMLRKESR